MAIVYMATNLVNGKRYIGVTTKALDVRRRGHLSNARNGDTRPFTRALRKYGEEAFCWTIMRDFLFPEHAREAEERYITRDKPEYNRSAGPGLKNLKHSPESIEKMRAAKIGRPILKARGMKRSAEQRENLRKIGLQNRDKFIARMKPFPRKNSRPVICLDEMREFPSASAAARHYNLSKSGVIETCLGSHTREACGGWHFQYIGSPPPPKLTSKRKLNLAQVAEIRNLRGQLSCTEIGVRYGVNRVTILDIFLGRSWKEKPNASAK